MMVAVALTDEIEARLAAKAKSAGLNVSDYAARVLHEAAIRPSLDSVLDPIRRNFAKSGLTEDQASEFYEAEKHAERAKKRGRPFDE